MSLGHDLGTLLGIWAHPDDETFLMGGLMAQAVQHGASVTCVTATRGEQGSSDERRWPPGAPLAAIRTAELEAALAELGVSDHEWLDYPDGGCVGINDEDAIDRITAVVERVRPDTVLTFGPEGMTGHDDHICVSRWTTAAVKRFDGNSVTLGYATKTPQWLAAFRPQLDSLGVFMGAEPPCTAPADLLIDNRFDDELLERKLRAILLQTSQIEPMVNAVGPSFLRESLAEEQFRLA